MIVGGGGGFLPPLSMPLVCYTILVSSHLGEVPVETADNNYRQPLSLTWYLDIMSSQIIPRFVDDPESAKWLVMGTFPEFEFGIM